MKSSSVYKKKYAGSNTYSYSFMYHLFYLTQNLSSIEIIVKLGGGGKNRLLWFLSAFEYLYSKNLSTDQKTHFHLIRHEIKLLQSGQFRAWQLKTYKI